MERPALALIEFSSIALGTRAVDALIKKAPVVVERFGTLQPGKLAVLFGGEVAEVEESYDEALRVAGRAVSDKVMLPHVDASVYRATLGQVDQWQGDTLGVIETDTFAPVLLAADAAVKGANVRVVQIRLADGLGGKGLAHFVGEQHDVEAGIEIATGRITDGARQVHCSITPRYDGELRARLAASTRFWGESEGQR